MLKLKSKKLSLSYSVGRHKTDARPKSYDGMSWREFKTELTAVGTDPELGVSINGDEILDRYDELKARLPYVAAAYTGNRRNDNVDERSLLFIDIDKVKSSAIRRVRRALDDAGLMYIAYATCGDRHDVKGGVKMRCWRFIVPTDRPLAADEIWPAQHKFIHMLGLDDMDGIDSTANQRARLMFGPHIEAEIIEQDDGKPANVRRLMRVECDVPDESGTTNWTDTALENASENSQAIAAWCWEMGLTGLSSGRGFAIQCPNHYSHTGDDGTDGSTAIMMPDATHPEVRFACQHEHCQKHNTHQHMMLRLVGIPDQYLPEAHNISKKQIAELLPDLCDEEIESVYEAEITATIDGPNAGSCTSEDLDDDPVTLFTKRDPIIEGLINFKNTFYLAGPSNIGKSFYVMGQMATVAAGIPFGGRRVVKSHCFYFDAEGGETSVHRKQALQKMYADDLDWLHIIDLQSKGIDITDKRGVKEVCKIIRDASGDDPVGLVAFDSLNQTVAMRSDAKKPFDENSPTDMGEIVRALKTITEVTGGAAGVIHHPAKSSGPGNRTARGSGALHGAVDYAFFVEQPDPDKPLQINLYHEKSRNGVKQSPRGFVLQKCKIEVPKSHEDRVDAYLSTAAGPEFNLDGQTVKPLEVSPRDETLFLVPVALAPFATPAEEAGKEAVAESKAYEDGPAGLRTKSEKLMVAQLEKLPDRPEGYSPFAIGTADGAKMTSGNYRKVLDDLVARRILVNGCNQQTGEILASQYRLPIGPNDFDPPELSATNDDLGG